MKSKYELLRTKETSKDLSEDFVKSFENALVSAYNNYVDSAQQMVDSFEDNPMELAYAKGFLAGCIHVDNLPEEPISKIWHDSNKEQPKNGTTVAVWNGSNGEILPNIISVNPNRIWAYMDDLLNKKEQEPVSEDLEEAAKEYADKHGVVGGYRLDQFIAGANWKEEQMMKNAMVVPIAKLNTDLTIDITYDEEDEYLRKLGCREGDKVKLIIVKEE